MLPDADALRPFYEDFITGTGKAWAAALPELYDYNYLLQSYAAEAREIAACVASREEHRCRVCRFAAIDRRPGPRV